MDGNRTVFRSKLNGVYDEIAYDFFQLIVIKPCTDNLIRNLVQQRNVFLKGERRKRAGHYFQKRDEITLCDFFF